MKTNRIVFMTDYQKEIMIKTLVSMVKMAHEEGFSMYCCMFWGGGAACPAWREPPVRSRRSLLFDLMGF